jgi:hypothetical protein
VHALTSEKEFGGLTAQFLLLAKEEKGRVNPPIMEVRFLLKHQYIVIKWESTLGDYTPRYTPNLKDQVFSNILNKAKKTLDEIPYAGG